MIIKHINKFFTSHGRWIFAIFTVVIIIAFMDFMVPGKSGLSCGGQGQGIGSINGRTVGNREFAEFARLQQLGTKVLFNQWGEIKEDAVFMAMVWNDAAVERGIVIGDEQVAKAITGGFKNLLPENFPGRFQKDGKFDLAQYQSFLQDIARSGFNGQDVDEAVRMLLTQDALRESIIGSITVSENELEQYYKMQKTGVKYRLKEYNAAANQAKVELSEEAVLKFYSEHKAAYQIGAQAQAFLVIFAKDKAAEGHEFARYAYKKVSENPTAKQAAFTEAAQDKGLKLSAAVAVSADSEQVGNLTNKGLVDKLLKADSGVPVIDGNDGDSVVVGFVFDQKPARQANYGEVSKQVRNDYIETLNIQAAREVAQKAFDALLKSENLNKTVTKDRNFNERPVFYRGTMPQDLVDFLVMGEVAQMTPGELRLVKTTTGAVLVFCEAVIPADMTGFAAQKGEISEPYLRVRQQLELLRFQEEILKNSNSIFWK